jgi:hypothetical protein
MASLGCVNDGSIWPTALPDGLMIGAHSRDIPAPKRRV